MGARQRAAELLHRTGALGLVMRARARIAARSIAVADTSRPVTRSASCIRCSVWWPSPQPISSSVPKCAPRSRAMIALVSANRACSCADAMCHGSGIL